MQGRRLVFVLHETELSNLAVLVSFFVRGETGLALSGDIDELSGSSGLLEIGLHVGKVAVDEFNSHGFLTRG